jgi:hypothetical protein
MQRRSTTFTPSVTHDAHDLARGASVPLDTGLSQPQETVRRHFREAFHGPTCRSL